MNLKKPFILQCCYDKSLRSVCIIILAKQEYCADNFINDKKTLHQNPRLPDE